MSKQEELIKREPIENSPFVCITTEKGSWVVLGNFRVTEIRDSKDEAIKEATAMTWNNIVKVISCVCESLKEFNEITKKDEN